MGELTHPASPCEDLVRTMEQQRHIKTEVAKHDRTLYGNGGHEKGMISRQQRIEDAIVAAGQSRKAWLHFAATALASLTALGIALLK